MSRPFFSVCLLAHNSAAYIAAAIESVMGQTDGDWEMIVADDASADGTVNAVLPYLSDARIRYFRHPANVRQPANWSSAIRAGEGLVVTTLHADDTYEPNALALFRDAMQAGVEFVWANWWRCGPALARLSAGPVNRSRHFSGPDACAWLARNNHALPSASAFRRALAERIAGPDNRFGMLCDRDYFLRLALAAEKARCIGTPVANYRVHDKSVTHAYAASGRLQSETLSFIDAAQRYLGPSLIAILRRDCASLAHWRFDALLYVCNHLVANLPSARLRCAFYRRVMAIKLGSRASILSGLWLDGRGSLRIGAGAVINQRCRLDARGGLTIGANVSISAEVHILTADHDLRSADFAGRKRPVVIGDFVFIGTRATVLPGVTVAEGAAIAAGAVVTKDVPAFAVVAGVPARVIGERPRDLGYTLAGRRHFI